MSTVTTLGVTGMTCGHCVASVTEEVEKVAGVENVSVELHDGGTSEVSVFSDEPLDEKALRDAVDEAGYAVDSVDVQQDALAAQYAEQAPGRQAAHDDASDAAATSFATRTADLRDPSA
ncbi:heavy-metal-associated domain-containing protein [Cellulosimicrobium sp. Marseille-Q8652]